MGKITVRDGLPDDPIYKEGLRMYSVRLQEPKMPITRITPEEADALGIPRVRTVISFGVMRPVRRQPTPAEFFTYLQAVHPQRTDAELLQMCRGAGVPTPDVWSGSHG